MSTYNLSSNPCCASGSLVWVKDLTKTPGIHRKPVENIVKGDVVSTDRDGVFGEIECVVRTECPGKKAILVQIGDLRVTPYHPIKVMGNWVFPSTMASAESQECEALYSFVVNTRRPMVVNGHIFSTWGHALEGPVIGHDYFGTEKVIVDMKLFTTYDLGIVNLVPDMIQRDPTSHRICGIGWVDLS